MTMIIRTKDTFYPNCSLIEGKPYETELVKFTSESKAGNVRTVTLKSSEITATEDTPEAL